jgi:hypothetical protein
VAYFAAPSVVELSIGSREMNGELEIILVKRRCFLQGISRDLSGVIEGNHENPQSIWCPILGSSQSATDMPHRSIILRGLPLFLQAPTWIVFRNTPRLPPSKFLVVHNSCSSYKVTRLEGGGNA